jgi:ATP/maltotriose-dependent transcriptional regulator MalT
MALKRLYPKVSDDVLPLLQSHLSPPIELILTTLINTLLIVESEVVLVLDDYHLIEEQTIHQALTFLLDHLLPQMHLIIVSRADSLMMLSRLRSLRQLTEFIHAFTSNHRYILDSLSDDVLDRQPEALQTFLLQPSLLERLCDHSVL